jgi:hypothetical protein
MHVVIIGGTLMSRKTWFGQAMKAFSSAKGVTLAA